MSWAPDYLTTAQAKAYLRIGDTVDDAEIATAITAASRAIDRACGRQFGRVAVAEQRWYPAECGVVAGRSVWLMPIDDLASTTGVGVVVDEATVTDYTFYPRNAVALGKVWTRLVLGDNAEAYPVATDAEVSVSALWGWPTVPTAIIQACKVQTARFMARRDSPYGIAGSPSDGSEMRLLASVDPDVRVMLREYVRTRRVA